MCQTYPHTTIMNMVSLPRLVLAVCYIKKDPQYAGEHTRRHFTEYDVNFCVVSINQRPKEVLSIQCIIYKKSFQTTKTART